MKQWKNIAVTTLQDISGENENNSYLTHKKHKDNIKFLEAHVNLLMIFSFLKCIKSGSSFNAD